MKCNFLLGAAMILSAALVAPAQDNAGAAKPAPGSTSSRQLATALMRPAPRLEYNPAAPPADMAAWRDSVGAAMKRLMSHPAAKVAAPARKVASARRDGYTLERWESYPIQGSTVAYLVLVPDSLAYGNPSPAVLCIPGFGQTKELLAGEPAGNYDLSMPPVDNPVPERTQALQYARKGLIAVAVDNPCAGELSDNGYPDYITTSRFLLEEGWNYLGLSAWQDEVILDEIMKRPDVRPDRVIVSGFSLGTEPLMAIGVQRPDIFAFVYNDFLCRTRERALVMDKPQDDGSRPFPNNIEHLIPGFLTQFDFPDIVAALSPRPVICTEGGMDRDFAAIGKAFEQAGAPDAFTFYHYPKYADPASRVYLDAMPQGVTRAEFFRLANVDSPSHGFKHQVILPWVDALLRANP